AHPVALLERQSRFDLPSGGFIWLTQRGLVRRRHRSVACLERWSLPPGRDVQRRRWTKQRVTVATGGAATARHQHVADASRYRAPRSKERRASEYAPRRSLGTAVLPPDCSFAQE